MPIVRTPDGKTVKFPDTMKMEEIQKVLDDQFSNVQGQEKKIEQTYDPAAIMGGSEPVTNEGSQTPRQAWDQVIKPTLEGGALVAGGAIGTATAGPAGGVLGAGLLYAQMKEVTAKIDNVIKSYAQEPIQDDNIKSATIRSLANARDGMVMQMGGEIAGKVIGGTANYFLAPGSKWENVAQNVANERAKNFGITPSPGESTGSRTMLQIESALANSPAASDVVKSFMLKKQIEPLMQQREALLKNTAANPKDIDSLGIQIYKEVNDYLVKVEGLRGQALENMRAKVIGEIGSGDTRLMAGLSAQDRIVAESQRIVKEKNALYDKATDAIKAIDKGDTVYEFPEMKRVANELLQKYEKIPPSALPSETRAWLEWASGKEKLHPSVSKQLEGISDPIIRDEIISGLKKERPELFPEKLDMESLTFARQELSRLIEKNNPAMQQGMSEFKGQTTPEGFVYSRLKEAATSDWRNIIESSGGEAKSLLDAADAFYVENIKEGVRSAVIKRIAYSDPEKVLDLAFKPNGMTEIATLRKFAGEDTFMNLRGQFTNKIMGTDKGAFNPQGLQNELQKYGDEFLSTIYNKNELQFLKDVSNRGLNLANQKIPSDAFIRNIAGKTPEVIVDAIIGAPSNRAEANVLYSNILNIKRVVDADTFKNIGDKLIEKIFQVNPDTKYLPAQTFANFVHRYAGSSGYGRNVLEALGLPKEKLKNLMDLADTAGAMASSQKVAANPSGTAQNLITWASMGMILRDPVRGIPTVISPRIMAKLWYSDFGMKYLKEGFALPASSKEGIALGTKLMGIINQEDVAKEQEYHGQYWSGKLE